MSASPSTLAVRTVPRPADGPRLTVDPAAIAANTRTLAAATPAALMAVVKADGFGHGAPLVARTALAHGASWLGVTSFAEALALREAGLDVPILSWLNGVDADHRTAVAAGVDIAVPSLAHLEALLAAGAGPARIHLHLDTGMARDGAEPASWATLCRLARHAERCGRVRVVGVMGHLPCADRPGDPANNRARTRFAWGVKVARASGLRPEHRHLAATAATLTDPRSHHTMVRVGAGLVGIDPAGSATLAGALTLTAPFISVRRVRPGTAVGYGHTWAATDACTLGLLPLGYADGLPLAASGLAEVLVRGERHRIVGRISMDQAVVDLGDLPVQPGETATVLGPGAAGEPTVADWAAWSGTLPHEIVTGFGARIDRTVVRPGPRRIG
jgi:alanine racemase